MIYELEKNKYKNVKDLINPDYLSVQLETVVNGNNPGHIYADDLDNPQAAIVYHQGEGGFYFVGNPESESFLAGIESFMNRIKEEFIEHDIREFEFSGDSQEWEKRFRKIFFQYDLYESTQRVYLHKEGAPITLYSMDETIELKPINTELMSQDKIKGFSFIEDEILTWWSSLEDYLLRNAGFVAVRNDKIIGRCILDGNTESMMAIGIEVKEKYRGSGIASTLASHMIQDVIDKGYQPYWECMDDNKLSIRLAEKCGLSLAYTYKLFGFTI